MYSKFRIGTSRSDTITATDEATLILGLGGDDIIFGGSGNDYIYGAVKTIPLMLVPVLIQSIIS